MKAAVFRTYGPAEVLAVEEVDRPAPRADEVLIRVVASAVSAEDPKLRSFDHPPLLWLPVGLLFGLHMGFRAAEARAALASVCPHVGAAPVFVELLREALRALSRSS